MCLFPLSALGLQVLHKRVPCRKKEQSLFLTAVENTWIHRRQKRREQNRQLRELPRAPPSSGTGCQTTSATAASAPAAANAPPPQTQQPSTDTDNIQNNQNESTTAQELASQQPPEEQASNGATSHETSREEPPKPAGVLESGTGRDVDMEASSPTSTAPLTQSAEPPATGQETGPREAPAEAQEVKCASQEEVPAKQQPPSPGSVEHFLFKSVLNVVPEESDVVIEMHWVDGQNKDLMNQLCTYLKNMLLKTVAKP